LLQDAEDEQHFIVDFPACSHIKDKQAKVFQQTCIVPGFLAKCEPDAGGVFIKGMLLLSEVYFVWINLPERNSVCAPRTLILNHKIIQYNIIWLYSLFHSGVHRWFAVDATAVTAFGVCSAVHTRKQAA